MKVRLMLSALLFSLPSWAEESFLFSGFGTLGLVQVQADRHGYRTDVTNEDGTFDGEWDFRTTSVLGLQPEFRFNPNFDFVSQFQYRNQNSRTLDTMTSLAFFRYKPSVNWSFRLGRTAIDLFHLTEYRDVGFAYPWAKAPSELYSIIPYRHLDGADANYSHQLGAKTLHTKVFAGVSRADVASYEAPEHVKIDNILGLSIELEAYQWSVKANVTTLKIEDNNASTDALINTIKMLSSIGAWPNGEAFAEDLSMKNKTARYAALSGRYDYDNWSLMSEVSHINGDSTFIRDINSGYASVIYNHESHSFYTIFGVSNAKTYHFDEVVDPNIVPPRIGQFVELGANYFAPNQQSMSVGWRWNLSDTLALKAQWEKIKIEDHGHTFWINKDFTDTQGETAHVFYTNLSFMF